MHPRVGLNHVKENKFIHNFQYSIDPLSSCVNSIKCTILFFRHCANYTFQKQTLLNKMRSIYPNIFGRKKLRLLKCLENRILLGKSDLKYSLNKEIVYSTISFILSTEPFICPLF